MKTHKKTAWFAGNVKPARVGVYQRQDRGTDCYDGSTTYSHWNGVAWGHLCLSEDSAQNCENTQYLRIRLYLGAASPPIRKRDPRRKSPKPQPTCWLGHGLPAVAIDHFDRLMVRLGVGRA